MAEDQTKRQKHTSYWAALSVSDHTSNLGSDHDIVFQIQGSGFIYKPFSELNAFEYGSSTHLGGVEYVERVFRIKFTFSLNKREQNQNSTFPAQSHWLFSDVLIFQA